MFKAHVVTNVLNGSTAVYLLDETPTDRHALVFHEHGRQEWEAVPHAAEAPLAFSIDTRLAKELYIALGIALGHSGEDPAIRRYADQQRDDYLEERKRVDRLFNLIEKLETGDE